jgi:antitoxin VapB
MTSLYIKDSHTAELAERVARIRGVTKTKAVRDALEAALQGLRPKERKPELVKWIERRRIQRPLHPTGREADKAFFDELWGDA